MTTVPSSTSTTPEPIEATTDALKTPRYSAMELVWVLACFLGGAFLRAANLAARPLWDDELTTIITANRSFWDGLYTGQDPQPPLHQWLVRLIMGIKDETMLSEPLLRLPACAFGIGVILATWWAARHFVGRFGAAIVILLVAVNPILVHHARDARPYSLYIFFAVLSMTFFYRLVRQGGKGNVIGYAIATGGMFFSHYYAMFFVAAQIAYFVIDFAFGGDSKRRFKIVMIGFFAALALSWPGIALFARLFFAGMGGTWWISVPGPIDGIDAMGELLGVASVSVLCLIPLVSAIWRSRTPFDEPGTDVRHASWQQWWHQRRPALYLTLCVGFVIFVPIAGSIAMGMGGWVARYSIPVFAPVLFLGVLYLHRVGPTALGIVVIAMFALTAPKALRQPCLTGKFKEEAGARHAIATLDASLQPGDTVVLPNWPFSDDYKNTTKLACDYYGYEGPITYVSIHELDAYLFGFKDEKSKITRERYEEIKDNPDLFLPPGRTYLLCFRTTVNQFKELMRRQGRAYKTQQFGLYDNGPHAMYTLVTVAPRGATIR